MSKKQKPATQGYESLHPQSHKSAIRTDEASSSRSQKEDIQSEQEKKKTQTGPMVAVGAHSVSRRHCLRW